MVEFPYRLSLVPFRVELLFSFQAEESVLGHIVHLVVHNPMRLGIKTLQDPEIKTQSQGVVGSLSDYLLSPPSLKPKYYFSPQQLFSNCRIWFQPRGETPSVNPPRSAAVLLNKHM